jgi:type IV fimbrial biogenesis protein FimT
MPRLVPLHAMRGFTLVELMTGIGISAILAAIAVPQFNVFIQNARIRASAESLQNGLSLARAEAVRRNERVEFVRSSAGWTVNSLASGTLHEAGGKEGTKGLSVMIGPDGADRITYDSAGRRTPNQDDSDPIVSIDIGSSSPSSSASYRPLRIQMQSSGSARLCWPAAPKNDTRMCL